jgi:hypothetical protein
VLRLSIDIHKEEHFSTTIALGDLEDFLWHQGKKDEADRVSLMSRSELQSYLAEDNWNGEKAKIWARNEAEEVFKYYPYPHTMYCGCHLWTTRSGEEAGTAASAFFQ